MLSVMIAATLWRMALLPDWAYGLTGAPPPFQNPKVLFVIPACVGFVGGVLMLKKWLTTASADALEPWRRWGSRLLVAYAVICTLLYFSFIARSLGFAGPFSPPVVSRAIVVLCASLVIVAANWMPKLPWVPSRWSIGHLDPVHGARLLRSGGRLMFLWGIAVAISALLTPLRMMFPLLVAYTIALVLAVGASRLALHREQSRERPGNGI
jgi:hypothetical protein